jgi:hypothetical protein
MSTATDWPAGDMRVLHNFMQIHDIIENTRSVRRANCQLELQTVYYMPSTNAEEHALHRIYTSFYFDRFHTERISQSGNITEHPGKTAIDDALDQ